MSYLLLFDHYEDFEECNLCGLKFSVLKDGYCESCNGDLEKQFAKEINDEEGLVYGESDL